mmetsp:Transcript_23540/g.26410  ORF Transcript_23540/g.26410 Transcript_23540/m.26410 type:complete len:110 (+) Transcript_23540:713-1042(+)
MALYSSFLSNLRTAQTNGDEETFASIEIDRLTVKNTVDILLQYKKVMSPYLEEYMRLIIQVPITFESKVNEIVSKMMNNDDVSDSSTVISEDDDEIDVSEEHHSVPVMN